MRAQCTSVNAQLTPNKRNLLILRGEECFMQLKMQQPTSSKRETLDQFRFKTESDAYMLQKDDAVSVQSFQSVEKPVKQRECGACQIY
jgi:hypothetical protein